MKFLTREQKQEIADKFGIPMPILNTVIEVESSGAGFDPKTGLIKIQFEPYHFEKYTKKRVPNGVENEEKEWEAFKVAAALDAEAAYLSTSWGLGQVMGFNFREAGYKSAHAMVDDFAISERNQLIGMLNFIRSNPIRYKALLKKDWDTFASLYNGKQYKKFEYDIKLAKAYAKNSKV